MGCKEISQRVGEVGGHHCARLSCLNVKYNRVSVCMNSPTTEAQIFSKDRSQNPVNQCLKDGPVNIQGKIKLDMFSGFNYYVN